MFGKSSNPFNSCTLKEVVTSRGSTSSNADATLHCPTIEDGAQAPVASNSNILTASEGKAATNAVKQLAVICGQTICQSCIYTSVTDRTGVELIRQDQAAEKAALAEMRLNTLRSALAARTFDMQALDVAAQLRALE